MLAHLKNANAYMQKAWLSGYQIVFADSLLKHLCTVVHWRLTSKAEPMLDQSSKRNPDEHPNLIFIAHSCIALVGGPGYRRGSHYTFWTWDEKFWMRGILSDPVIELSSNHSAGIFSIANAQGARQAIINARLSAQSWSPPFFTLRKKKH